MKNVRHRYKITSFLCLNQEIELAISAMIVAKIKRRKTSTYITTESELIFVCTSVCPKIESAVKEIRSVKIEAASFSWNENKYSSTGTNRI